MKTPFVASLFLICATAAPAATALHHYTFEGAAVTDSVGTDHGTLLNGATVTNGILSLDGTDDYVQFAAKLIPTTGPFTVAFLAAEGTPIPNSNMEMISQGASFGPGFYVGYGGSRLMRIGDSWQDTGVVMPADQAWHHYAVTVDETGSRLYLDGVLRTNTATITVANTGTDTRLGRQFYYPQEGTFGPEMFRGAMDELWVFSGALSASQVAALATLPPTAPFIAAQPASQTATLGDTVVFTVGVAGSTPLSYQWSWNGTNLAGATQSSLTLTDVQFSHAGSYVVVVTNPIGSATSASAILTVVAPTAPSIVTQPVSQTVSAGAHVTFSVMANGTAPLRYQWSRTGTNLAGATASALQLNSVQVSQSGLYAVTVTNALGSVTSSNATLTVTPGPAVVRVVGTSTMAGAPVTVPVEIAANGNENAIQFSLSYIPTLMAFSSVQLGPNFSEATLFVNTSQTNSGRVGIILALPTDVTMVPGTQALVHVTFTTPIRTSSTVAPVSFVDAPTARQLVDTQARTLSANYSTATVSLSPSVFEGDVSPRPGGDRTVTVSDWVQLGRYAARLDYPTNASEFQRADCAPRGTAGDGQIKVTDWVQAGRYAGGADPLTVVGGPTNEAPSIVPGTRGPKDLDRRVVLGSGSYYGGQTGVVTVVLEALGNESALGFSLAFDASRFAFVSATKGTSSTSATLNVNLAQAGAGKVGVALALSTGTFPAGGRELVKATFRALPGTPAGSSAVTFGDQPVPREVSDPTALPLVTTYVAGTLTTLPPPMLQITRSETGITLAWPLAASNYGLRSSADLNGSWLSVPGTPVVVNGQNTITLPTSTDAAFYRLVSP